jgi:hypothetical protein
MMGIGLFGVLDVVLAPDADLLSVDVNDGGNIGGGAVKDGSLSGIAGTSRLSLVWEYAEADWE